MKQWFVSARQLVSLVAACTALAITAVAARAQNIALADRGPKFLYAPSPKDQPVEIDITAHAMLRRRVMLPTPGHTVEELLGAIARQTGLHFVYSRGLVAGERRVELQAQSITVAAALTEILVDAGVDVLLSEGNQVTLVQRAARAGVAIGTIAGRVTDTKTQTALAGATVLVLGTSRGATTGSDGRYRIAGVAPGTYTMRARYIGYTPGSASVTVSANQEATADLALEKSAQRLDEVVTTGTVVPTEVKALPTPISVITGDQIEQKGYQRVDQIFRGDVPGAIAWDRGPYDVNSNIAVRGASTFGIPTIKTFIDGVEVANPLDIAIIDPNSVERIEITRGPQGSTLYGAGSLNGVMQIFTKKGQLGLTRPEVTGRISAGGIGGYNGSGTALETDDALSLSGGGEKTSYSLSGSYRHMGEWVPGYNSSHWGVSVGGQTTQGPFTISSSARYTEKKYDTPWDTRFRSYTYFSQPFYAWDRFRQQTYGVTASLQATPSMRHTLTLGYDRNLDGGQQVRPRFTTPADSFLFYTTSDEGKISLLYHTDLSLRLAPAVAAIVTAGVNHDAYDYVYYGTSGLTATSGNSLMGSTFGQRATWTTTGIFGQVQFNLAERFFLTGGVRAERNADFGTDFGTAWSPRVGAAYVLGFGPVAVKLRASYGESIRAPTSGDRDAQEIPDCCRYLANPHLAPERQRGVDGGFDVSVGRASLGVSYYRQRVIDLIAATTISTPAGSLPTYQFQNISRVKNEGWEFEGRLPVGPVQLAGTYSITASTIQELPPDYPSGDLQVGDRFLGIPHTSAGVTVTYSPVRRTTLTASMTHIGHWTGYDWLTLYGFYFGGQPYLGSTRAYWIEYPTVTKFSVGLSEVLTEGLTAFVRAENVGNNLRYEQDNSNMPRPRSIVIGVNVRH